MSSIARTAPPQKREIRSLTGLRGVAACVVVAYHYAQIAPTPQALKGFVARGYLCVDLFFVLSGFVMSLTYGRAFQKTISLRSYASFLYKRFGRVYPVYAVLTALVFATLRWHPVRANSPTFATLGLNLAAVQAWGFGPSIIVAAWSISTEVAAYAAFPAFVTLFAPHRRWVVVILTCAAAVATLAILGSLPTSALRQPLRSGPLDIWAPYTVFPLLRCIAGFALGMASFRIAEIQALRRIASRALVCDLAAGSTLAIYAIPGSDSWLPLSFALLVPMLSFGRGNAAKVLSSPTLHWFGLISYSLYLVHVPVMHTFFAAVSACILRLGVPHALAVSGLLCFLVSVAIASLTYHAIEKPSREFFRRVARRETAHDPQTVPALATTTKDSPPPSEIKVVPR